MPGRVSNKTLVEDFMKGYNMATISDFRRVDLPVVEGAVRCALHRPSAITENSETQEDVAPA